MARTKHPDGSEAFDVSLPEGYDVEGQGSALEAAAREHGWSIEHDGPVIVVRDVWTDNDDHAAWLVATPAGVALESVTVWAGRDA